MKRLQEETGVKMSILGKGSMRDKEKVRHILICAGMWLFGSPRRIIYRNPSTTGYLTMNIHFGLEIT